MKDLTTKVVKVGVIGIGDIFRIAHAPAWQKIENAKMVAICDVVPQMLELWGNELGVEKRYGDYRKLLADDEVEIVDILTRYPVRAEIAVAAAEAGKHVIVEKPMCASIREADEMIKAAKNNGVKLMMAESYCFQDTTVKARELIDAGEIGEPMQFMYMHGEGLPPGIGISREISEENRKLLAHFREARTSQGRSTSKPNSYARIMDMGQHYFGVARYLMKGAEIVDISVRSQPPVSKSRTEEVVLNDLQDAIWTYEGGQKKGVLTKTPRGVFNVYRQRHTVLGTDGVIEVLGHGGGPEISGEKLPGLILYKRGQTIRFKFKEDQGILMPDYAGTPCYYDAPGGAFYNELKHFAECVLENKESRYTGEDGKKDLMVTLACIKSAVEGKTIRVADLPSDYSPESL